MKLNIVMRPAKVMRKPLPIPPKLQKASLSLTADELKQLARNVSYIGSVQHKDTKSFAGAPSPRAGATHIGAELESADCMLCPRKWAWAQDAATMLLKNAIELGQFDSKPEIDLPKYVWARDPIDRGIVYEARRLSSPPTGYKAYPLTKLQTARLAIVL